MAGQDFGYSQQTLFENGSDTNAIVFIIRSMLARVSTCKIVVVKGFTAGPDGTAGTVHAQPLVQQVDGAVPPNAFPHGTVYNLLYLRQQAGVNAVILEPEVGDHGICVVCDRDNSKVRASKAEAPPGSGRWFDLADGIYIGGLLNAAAQQFVKFTSTGLVIQDKNGNVMEFKSGSIDVTTPAFRVNGSVVAGFGTGDAVTLQTHKHPTAGAGAPSPPTPGT